MHHDCSQDPFQDSAWSCGWKTSGLKWRPVVCNGQGAGSQAWNCLLERRDPKSEAQSPFQISAESRVPLPGPIFPVVSGRQKAKGFRTIQQSPTEKDEIAQRSKEKPRRPSPLQGSTPTFSGPSSSIVIPVPCC